MSNENDDYYFLRGGGEMGERIRATDWSKTALGDPKTWPKSLCTMVAVMLENPFGMYIAWGSEYIQLYNDGYRPILGATKHPTALGISTRETFSEIWDIIGPMFEGVINGKAVGFPDFMLPLNRNGFVEECYFDFSYSPIRKDDGQVGGILVTVIETTNRKITEQDLKESEARFRTIADDAPVFIFLAGENAEVEYLNKTWREYTGIATEDSRGRAWAEITHPDDVDPATKIYMDGFNNRVSCSFENRQKGTDGIYRTILWRATPRFSPNGQFIGMMGVGFDIHERKKAEEKLRESEQQFNTLANNIQNLAWIADGEGYIFWYNQRWYEYTGTTLEEMKGWGWEKVHHPNHVNSVVDFVKKAWQVNQPFELTFPLRGANGKYRWFLTRAFPVCDEEGKIINWIGTNTDIHEQKIQEEKKDEFISIASHEMKTPLTTAKAYLQMLELSLDEKDEDSNLFAKKAVESVNRLNELVGELLDASKIRQGKLSYTITTFNFNEMIESTVDNVQLTSQTHTIIKTGNVSDEVTGDKDRLQQVVINLLNNAVKYSPGRGKVFINIEQEKDLIKVSVKDNGIGMSKQSLDKIFDKYHRIEEHAVHFQGLGIGLYISHEIIQRHQGKLWAESEPGKGSTFYFTIPLSIHEPQ